MAEHTIRANFSPQSQPHISETPIMKWRTIFIFSAIASLVTFYCYKEQYFTVCDQVKVEQLLDQWDSFVDFIDAN